MRPDNDVLIQAGTTTYAIFDGANQRVGIGTTAPQAKLHVTDATSSGAFNSLSRMIVEGGDTSYLPANKYGGVLFSDGTTGQGAILYDHTNDILHLKTSQTNRLNISSGGNVGIGTATPNQALEVVGNITTSALDTEYRFGNRSDLLIRGHSSFDMELISPQDMAFSIDS